MAQTPNHMLKELTLVFESLITCLNITSQTNKIEREKMETHFGRGCNLRELLVGGDNRLGFPCFAEHLLRLEVLNFFQNQVFVC